MPEVALAHLPLDQKLTGRSSGQTMDGALLPCPRPDTDHLFRYWQQQDPTELLFTALQEAASQARGPLGKTPAQLEPPLLAEPPRMAQAMGLIPAVLRVL